MERDINEFLTKKDQIVAGLAERFRTHDNRPTVEKIEEYLQQFETSDRARLALRILHEVEFIDSGKIRAMFREFFFNVLTPEQRARAVFAVLGGPEDSSSLIAYHCSKALTEREKPNQLFKTVQEIIKRHASERALVLFVDDNIGSGKQSTAIFREWMGLASGSMNHGGPLAVEEREWLKRGEILFFFLTGFEEGIENLRREVTRLGMKASFWAARKMSEAIGCFSPSSLAFDDETDRRTAEAMAREIGYELLRDKSWEDVRKKEWALGYGNSQKLIVFSYNTPTCTLPILWKFGTFRGKEWKPLFPRTQQRQIMEGVQREPPQRLLPAQIVVTEGQTEIRNPYNIAKPAEKLFRGRDREIKRLTDILKDGESAVVFGLQRMGKTSLVLKVLDEAIRGGQLGRNMIPIRIDAFQAWSSFTSDAEFMFMILDELADYQGGDPQKTREAFRDFMRASYSASDRFKKFKTLLQRAAELTKSSLLLFIDEFHDIEKAFENPHMNKVNPFDAGVIRWLGYLVKSGVLQMVLCCRHKAMRMEKRFELELFKLLEEIHLGPLDEDSARSLIRDPLIRVVRYEDQAIQQILLLTGAQPFLIQYFCSALISDPGIKRSRIVRKKDVDDCAEDMTSDPVRESKFDVLYEDFRKIDGGLPWKALLSLAASADSPRKHVRRDEIQENLRHRLNIQLSSNGMQTAMDTLVLSKIVSHEGKSPVPSYQIRPDLLRMWLRKQRFIEKVV